MGHVSCQCGRDGSPASLSSLLRRTSTMKQIWSYKFEGRGIGSRKPALCGDGLFVAFTSLRGDTFDSHLVCLNASVGKENWRRKDESLFNDPIIDESNIVYVSSFSGIVHAFDRTGKRLWKSKSARQNLWVPCLAGDNRIAVAEIGQGSRTWCLDKSSGQVLWRYKSGDHSFPLASDGQTIVQSTGRIIHCLSAVSGTLLWKHENDIWFFKPCILNDVVLFGGRGCLRAYALADGAVMGDFQIDEEVSISSAIIPMKGKVYFGDESGILRCVSIGRFSNNTRVAFSPVWQFKADSEIAAAPVLVGDTLAALSKKGTVYLLDAASGTKEDEYQMKTKEDEGGLAEHRGSLFVAHGNRVCRLTE